MTDSINEEIGKAGRFHEYITHAREWSAVTGAKIRAEADVREELGDISEEDADALRDVAEFIERVNKRVRNGDDGFVSGPVPSPPQDND